MDTEKLLTYDSAGEYLGVSPWTLKHWVSDRKVPFVKLGSAVRFRRQDLDRFVRRHVVHAKATGNGKD